MSTSGSSFGGPLYVTTAAGTEVQFIDSAGGLLQNGTALPASAKLAYLTSAVAGTNTASSALVVDSVNRIDNIVMLSGAASRFSFDLEGNAGNVSMRVKPLSAANTVAATIATLSLTNVSGGCTLMVEVSANGDAGDAVEYSMHSVALGRVAGANSVRGTVVKSNVAVAGANSVAAVVAVAAATGAVGATNTHLVTVTGTKTGGASVNIIYTVRYWILNNTANFAIST